jgi:lysyl-tRNA synthetase class 2
MTKVGELSLFASAITVLSPCLHDVPDVLKDSNTQLRQRHLHMRVNPWVVSNLKTRAAIIQSIRNTLTDQDFVEVETPVLWPIVGGASARPFATRSNALGQDLSLRIATELFLKTLVVGGMDRVFELGKQFRNEGVDATHNPEFTTCEAYMAYQVRRPPL